MADVTVLRTSAIVQNAAVGTSRPPLVSAGALPLVQVKMTPAGPQIHEGQQRPVQMLPPNSRGASVQAGQLPMVQVKMTQNGPQPDDGQNRAVVIKDSRHGAVNAGGLPMVQVRMDGGKPQVQTVSNVHGGPPQIPAAAPALSQPRVARIAAPRQVQVYPQPQIVQAQIAQAQVQSSFVPQMPELSTDQVLFVRHLVDKYLAEHAGNVAADSTTADNVKLAEDTIFVFDRMIAAVTAQIAEGSVEIPVTASVVEVEAVPVATVPVVAAPVARVATVGYVAPAAYTPMGSTAPKRGYVAPRPDGRRVNVPASMRTGNASLAPRRVARAQAGALPMVQVKMDGQRAVVVNQAEVAAAKEAQAQAELQARAEALVAAAPPLAPAPAPAPAPVVVAEAAAVVSSEAATSPTVAPEAPVPSASQATEGGQS